MCTIPILLKKETKIEKGVSFIAHPCLQLNVFFIFIFYFFAKFLSYHLS